MFLANSSQSINSIRISPNASLMLFGLILAAPPMGIANHFMPSIHICQRSPNPRWCQTPQLLRCNDKELPLPRQPEVGVEGAINGAIWCHEMGSLSQGAAKIEFPKHLIDLYQSKAMQIFGRSWSQELDISNESWSQTYHVLSYPIMSFHSNCETLLSVMATEY